MSDKQLQCGKCGDTNPDSFFPSVVKRSKQGWCKACHRAYYRAQVVQDREYFLKYARRRLRRTKDQLAAEKKALGCERCGENHPACLGFHHREQGDKVFNISLAVSRGKKGIEAIRSEIDKCVVLCSNCHRKLHYEQRALVPIADQEIRRRRGAVKYGN